MALRQPGKRAPTTDNSVVQRTVIPTIRRETDDADDELLILRGITRIVEKRSISPFSDNDYSSEQKSAPGLQVPRRSGHLNDPSLPSNRPSAHDQEHTAFMEGTLEPQLSRMETPHTAACVQPQAGTATWLKELEDILGSPATLQQSGCNQHQGSGGGISRGVTENAYPLQSMPAMNTHTATDIPMPFFPGLDDGTGFARDVLLNETVSTGEWNQFIQQSGLSDTPLFDFDLDSSAPHTHPAVPDRRPDPTRTPE